MAIAANLCLVTAATGISATYVTINGIKDFSLSDADDLLDITDFADGRVHARIAALRDATLSISGDYEPTDTTGIGKVQAAKRAGDPIAIQVWFSSTGSQGFALAGRVESIEYSGNVEGKVELSASISVDTTIVDPIP